MSSTLKIERMPSVDTLIVDGYVSATAAHAFSST
jgi:hypothetical protein